MPSTPRTPPRCATLKPSACATWRQTPDGQAFGLWAQRAQRLAEDLRQADIAVRGALADDWAAAAATGAGQEAGQRAATRAGGLTAAAGLTATLLVAATTAVCFWTVAGGLPAVVLFLLVAAAGVVATMAAAFRRAARAYEAARGAMLREHLGLPPGTRGLREPDYAWTEPSAAEVVDAYETTIAAAPRTLPAPEQVPPLGLPPVALTINADTSTARLLREYEQQRRGR